LNRSDWLNRCRFVIASSRLDHNLGGGRETGYPADDSSVTYSKQPGIMLGFLLRVAKDRIPPCKSIHAAPSGSALFCSWLSLSA
jgi:hypothetical protein